jgi:hypothetical protein
MSFQITNNLRLLLKKRIDKLDTRIDLEFYRHLEFLWQFIDSQPVCLGIIESLINKYPNLSEDVEKILYENAIVGESEEEAAAIGYAILRRLSSENFSAASEKILQTGTRYQKHSDLDNCPARIHYIFLKPFYEYLDEQLYNPNIILNLLTRYKQRCEWFYRDHLNDLFELKEEEEGRRKSEKFLAMDLYSFLHDQGFNFTIEPSSIYGKIDIIASQGTDDPLLADAKIFDAKRGKTYICDGFKQIYTYTQQFNEPFGYLVIFKNTEKDLCFSLPNILSRVPAINYNNKTIFFFVIDIFKNPKPTSQRGSLKVVTISEQDLIKQVQEINIFKDPKFVTHKDPLKVVTISEEDLMA